MVWVRFPSGKKYYSMHSDVFVIITNLCLTCKLNVHDVELAYKGYIIPRTSKVDDIVNKNKTPIDTVDLLFKAFPDPTRNIGLFIIPPPRLGGDYYAVRGNRIQFKTTDAFQYYQLIHANMFTVISENRVVPGLITIENNEHTMTAFITFMPILPMKDHSTGVVIVSAYNMPGNHPFIGEYYFDFVVDNSYILNLIQPPKPDQPPQQQVPHEKRYMRLFLKVCEGFIYPFIVPPMKTLSELREAILNHHSKPISNVFQLTRILVQAGPIIASILVDSDIEHLKDNDIISFDVDLSQMPPSDALYVTEGGTNKRPRDGSEYPDAIPPPLIDIPSATSQ
jgi:hypothetical protein